MKCDGTVEAFILAGGISSRMGRDKSVLEFQGVPLVARTALLVRSLVSKVTIVGHPDRHIGLGLNTLADHAFEWESHGTAPSGPLVGIASALSTSEAPWNLILACDLPYLTVEWLNWLLGRAAESPAQVVLPRTRRGLEPLAAVYRLECSGPIVAELARGVRKVTDALSNLRLEVLPESEWGSLAQNGNVLSNMNTPADYEEALAWWDSGKG